MLFFYNNNCHLAMAGPDRLSKSSFMLHIAIHRVLMLNIND